MFDVTIKDILEIPLVIVRQLRELLMKYVEYPKVYIDTQED